ncbi:cyclophilin-like fold protein, partial [Klebsiella pneumoniae]
GYYAPGQWIAVYFGPIGYWSGKVPLGRIHASVDEISAIPENTPVTIEKAK